MQACGCCVLIWTLITPSLRRIICSRSIAFVATNYGPLDEMADSDYHLFKVYFRIAFHPTIHN